MNQKELNEIRRRFKLDRNSISKICGCYVNSNKEIISWIDASMGLMQQEEQEMFPVRWARTLWTSYSPPSRWRTATNTGSYKPCGRRS